MLMEVASMNRKRQAAVEKLLLSIDEVADALSLGRSKVYQLIEAKEFEVVRVGRAVRITSVSLQAWLDARKTSASLAR
jgi:excisionase family DNA binding protein